MSGPVDPRVRLAISQWLDDAPRGSVTTFCAEHSISRKTFYALLARARRDGPAAVLEASGLDCGPISVLEKMRSMGIEPVPSAASLARIFRAAGVARLEPKKKPRAAYRRFVSPRLNQTLSRTAQTEGPATDPPVEGPLLSH